MTYFKEVVFNIKVVNANNFVGEPIHKSLDLNIVMQNLKIVLKINVDFVGTQIVTEILNTCKSPLTSICPHEF